MPWREAGRLQVFAHGGGIAQRLNRQRVIILGSTGSIGRNALDVVAAMPDEWDVVGLATGSRGADLAQQARRFKPAAVALTDENGRGDLAAAMNGHPTGVLTGPDAAVRLLDEVECDCVVLAITGAASLPPTLRAVELGRRVAIANKEALVMAGALLMPLARRTGAMLLPVDSEHSAVFQALLAGRRADVRRVILTASGGPFREWPAEDIENATLDDALNHPTWDMGPKVTIDSATMMNKALEIIEARWLFDLDPDHIDVVVHPESIIHSLVEYVDGSMIAQLSTPDMRTPIQYALTYPRRLPCPAPSLDLRVAGSLTLIAPDVEKFPALKLGHEVARLGGVSGAVLNAANEAGVDLFRRGAIRFGEIARLARRVLEAHTPVADPTLDDLLRADRWARNEVTECKISS